MSHSSGTVTFQDGLVMHYEYNGTVDFVIRKLYDTHEEMWDNWRKYDKHEDCTCGQDEEVDINCSYGSGHEWTGRACRHCKLITDGFSPYEDWD